MNKIIVPKIYTIGYNGLSLDKFRATLDNHGIEVLIDVRSIPYSKYNQEYNKETLKPYLENNDILYYHYEAFGGKQKSQEYISTNAFDQYFDYSKYVKSEDFLLTAKKIEAGLEMKYSVCLMCVEEKPEDCHRSIMIGRFFSQLGYRMQHIIRGKDPIDQKVIENTICLYEKTKDIATAYKKRNIKIASFN